MKAGKPRSRNTLRDNPHRPNRGKSTTPAKPNNRKSAPGASGNTSDRASGSHPIRGRIRTRRPLPAANTSHEGDRPVQLEPKRMPPSGAVKADKPPDIGKTDSTNKARDYEVGFGKPPIGSQFKKGQSGNPKGRPKKSSASPVDWRVLFDEISSELITVREGNRELKIPRIEAVIRQHYQDAFAGKANARKQILDLYMKARHADRVDAERRGDLTLEEEELLKRMLGDE